MRIRNFFGFFALSIVAIGSLIGDFVVSAFGWFGTPEGLRFADDDYGLSYAGGGEPLSAALQQSLRHEAGMRRVAAARKV